MTTTAQATAASRRRNAALAEYRPIGQLRPSTRQARRHPSVQIEKIKASIETFGFVGALLVTNDGEVIAGNARLEAARQLGIDELPVLVIDHLTEHQIVAYRIADNKLAELSDWDEDVLRLEFETIGAFDTDFDFEVLGFETAEIDLLLDGDTSEEDPDDALPVMEDDIAVTRRGDLWLVGEHRLLCGDAKSTEDYQRLMAGIIVRMVITDPPWNVPINGHVGNSGAIQHREFVEASGEMTDEAFGAFLNTVIEQMAVASAKGSLIYIFIDWRGVEKVLAAGRNCGLELINVLVWNKSNAGMGSLYRSKHELIVLFKKPGAFHTNNIKLGATGRYRTNVWDYAGANSFGRDRMAQLIAHPTAKPVAMIADAIKDVTKRGDVVLDPFCGSGTTLIAAQKCGRLARCMELDPLYVDLAVSRFEARFGIEAIHTETGQNFSEVAAARALEEPAELSDDSDQGTARPNASDDLASRAEEMRGVAVAADLPRLAPASTTPRTRVRQRPAKSVEFKKSSQRRTAR